MFAELFCFRYQISKEMTERATVIHRYLSRREKKKKKIEKKSREQTDSAALSRVSARGRRLRTATRHTKQLKISPSERGTIDPRTRNVVEVARFAKQTSHIDELLSENKVKLLGRKRFAKLDRVNFS